MKLLFITNNINQVGGVDRVLNRLANYFTEMFHYEIEILSIFTEKSELFYNYNELVKITHGKKEYTTKKNFFRDTRLLLQNNDADIIMTFHGYISNCILLNKDILKNKKIVVTEHGDYYDSTKIRRVIRSILYRKADKVVVLTNKSKELYDRYLNNVQVIRNATPFKTDEKSNLTNKKIIAVGRLEQVKGFDKLIKIFNKVAHKHSDWTLDIIGDGSQRNYLDKMIKEYGLKDKVKLKHFTKNIAEEYLESSMYVLTSKYEGFGLVLLEAKECGLPCISFDIDAAKEIILNNKDGIMVPYDDLDAFVEKLSLLIDNYELRREYGMNAIKDVEKYNLDNICNEWKILFENIIL